jgi:uncharacterized protein YjiK
MRKYFFIVFFIICGCSNSQIKKQTSEIGYILSEPDKTVILPSVLREISGLAIIDSSTIACIQDEKGIVYVFDLNGNQITKQIYFNEKGDYEGICKVDQTLYVLKSNGKIYKIANFETSSFADTINFSAVSSDDTEGLCYDQKNHRLLIAPKTKSGKESGFRKKQMIYSYDLISGQQENVPAYEIKIADVARFMVDDNLIKAKKSKKKKKSTLPQISLYPSEIAISPVSGKLFLLSSEDHKLFVFDTTGKVEYVENLDPVLLNKPEGLAFFENGDMLISNESGNKYPTILRFNYRNGQK